MIFFHYQYFSFILLFLFCLGFFFWFGVIRIKKIYNLKICHLSFLSMWHQHVCNRYHPMQSGNMCLVDRVPTSLSSPSYTLFSLHIFSSQAHLPPLCLTSSVSLGCLLWACGTHAISPLILTVSFFSLSLFYS